MIHGFNDESKEKVEVYAKSETVSKDTFNNHEHDSRYYTQAQVDSKVNSKQANITGGASTIATANLTANRALVSNGSGKVAVSGVTTNELSYLSGVTGKIQTQINGKANTSHNHDDRYYTEAEINNKLSATQNIALAKTMNANFEIIMRGTDDGALYRVVFTNPTIYFQKEVDGSWVDIKTWS